jgi:hypothetical protein
MTAALAADLLRRIAPQKVESCVVVRVGDALMANDDAFLCFFRGDEATVLALADVEPAAAAPDLLPSLVKRGLVVVAQVAATPRLLSKRALGIIRTDAVLSGVYDRRAVEQALGGSPLIPVRDMKEIGFVA